MINNEQESKRLVAVNSLRLLDSSNDIELDALVKLAAKVFEVPISTVTIIDSDRQWFKAAVGLSVKETPKEVSFCTVAIEQNKPLIINDTSKDVRFQNNPLLKRNPNLAFYAGVPLHTSDNYAIGTFCIMDSRPREFTKEQVEILQIMANQVMNLLELKLERNKYRDLMLYKDRVFKEVKASEERLEFAIEGSGDGIWDWDIKNNKATFSRQWKEMLGYTEDEIEDSYDAWLALIHEDDIDTAINNLAEYLKDATGNFRLEHRLLCKNKTYKWILSRGTIVEWAEDGTPKRMSGTHIDITNRKQAEEKIWRQANFDTLTGLPNRKMFFERLNEEVARASRAKSLFALMFIDLDGFKDVNDSLGHQAGDELLKAVTQRVNLCIRELDTFSRLGGDEFTIILSNIESALVIEAIANKILKAINKPFMLKNQEVSISASIGIAVYPKNGKNADALIRRADLAMYNAKAKGKNCWVFD